MISRVADRDIPVALPFGWSTETVNRAQEGATGARAVLVIACPMTFQLGREVGMQRSLKEPATGTLRTKSEDPVDGVLLGAEGSRPIALPTDASSLSIAFMFKARKVSTEGGKA